jgi:hypothetical protein
MLYFEGPPLGKSLEDFCEYFGHCLTNSLSCTRSEMSENDFRFVCAVQWGAGASVVVKALCYKPEGRGFETR